MLDQAVAEKWKALHRERVELNRSIAPELKAVRAKIEPRVTEIAEAIDEIEGEHGELMACETCDKTDALEDMIGSDEGRYFCSECVVRWRSENPESNVQLRSIEAERSGQPAIDE